MKIKDIVDQKKYRLIALFCFMVVAAIMAGSVFIYRSYISKPWLMEGSCADYGNIDLPVFPENTKAFADESPVIVIATALNPDAFKFEKFTEMNPLTPKLRVREVIKGTRTLKADDVIRLCPYNQAVFESNNYTVTLFLDGYTDGYWIPNTDYLGIVPQNSEGQFTTEWNDSFSISELRKIVK